MNFENFWYQLTIWDNTIKNLKFATEQLEKYHYPYVIKKQEYNSGCKRFAVFTMGDCFDNNWRNKMLQDSKAVEYETV